MLEETPDEATAESGDESSLARGRIKGRQPRILLEYAHENPFP